MVQVMMLESKLPAVQTRALLIWTEFLITVDQHFLPSVFGFPMTRACICCEILL